VRDRPAGSGYLGFLACLAYPHVTVTLSTRGVSGRRTVDNQFALTDYFPTSLGGSGKSAGFAWRPPAISLPHEDNKDEEEAEDGQK